MTKIILDKKDKKMADFTQIIQEINTNLPDNNTQSITAAKLRTTLIDLTEKIDDVQDDFEEQVNTALENVDTKFATNQQVSSVSIVNDLTTGGVNNVLSAEQGKEINEVLYDSTTSKNYLEEDGIITNLAIYPSLNKAGSNNHYSVCYKLITEETTFKVDIIGSGSPGSCVAYSDIIPAGNKNCTILATQSGTIVVPANKYLWWSISDQGNLAQVYTETTTYGNLKFVQKADILDYFLGIRKNDDGKDYFNGIRLVDTTTQMKFGTSTLYRIGNFVPVSATENTITLSTTAASDGHSDAECVYHMAILACKIDNGNSTYAYKFIYFSAADGNGVITKLYDFGANVNCNNIVSIESLHNGIDVIGSGGSVSNSDIHLSPYAYRAFAHLINEQLNKKSVLSNVFVGGWSSQYCVSGFDVVDSFGNNICTPVMEGFSTETGGDNYTTSPMTIKNKCTMIYKQSYERWAGPLYWTFYRIKKKETETGRVTFRINATHPFSGFLRVNCARHLEPQEGLQVFDGAVNIIVKDFDGNTIGQPISISYYADSYIIPLENKAYEGVDVIIDMPENKNTDVWITEMTLHENYAITEQLHPIDSNSKVALLGSSNTQYPLMGVANLLCPDDPDNVRVTWPDGTNADDNAYNNQGTGYLGKELARITGAVVDNWGKSGKTSFWGLTQTQDGVEVSGQIKKIFDFKNYTHIILSLFANDLNDSSIPNRTMLANVRYFCEYAKGHGCTPIVIMGYGKAGGGGYSLMYEDLTQGFDSPFVSTTYTNTHS